MLQYERYMLRIVCGMCVTDFHFDFKVQISCQTWRIYRAVLLGRKTADVWPTFGANLSPHDAFNAFFSLTIFFGFSQLRILFLFISFAFTTMLFSLFENCVWIHLYSYKNSECVHCSFGRFLHKPNNCCYRMRIAHPVASIILFMQKPSKLSVPNFPMHNVMPCWIYGIWDCFRNEISKLI